VIYNFMSSSWARLGLCVMIGFFVCGAFGFARALFDGPQFPSTDFVLGSPERPSTLLPGQASDFGLERGAPAGHEVPVQARDVNHEFPLWFLAVPFLVMLAWVLGFFGKSTRKQPGSHVLSSMEEPRPPQIATVMESLSLPEDAVFLHQQGDAMASYGSLVGSNMLVGIGTYGLNQLARYLTMLEQCGLERIAGSILAVENDANMVARFRANVPRAFEERIVTCASQTFSGGFGNRAAGWVMRRVGKWGVRVQTKTQEAINRHLRLNEGRAPGSIFLFLSQGGQFPVGLAALGPVRDKFRDALVIAFTALPRHSRMRRRFVDFKLEYEAQGVFGWVLQDNLGADPVTADYGMVALPLALADAALHGDHATQPNNAFSLAFTEEKGSVLVYRVVSSTEVAFPFRSDVASAPRYFTYRQRLVDAVIDELHDIEDQRGILSAELPVIEDETSVFDVVLLGVAHDDLGSIADAVTAGRVLEAQYLTSSVGGELGPSCLFGRANYETPFASIATSISADDPLCPVITVRLMAVRDGAHIVDEIAKPPELRSLGLVDLPPISSNGARSPASASAESRVRLSRSSRPHGRRTA
jgi:hypothetical protein